GGEPPAKFGPGIARPDSTSDSGEPEVAQAGENHLAMTLSADICQRAVRARDARFDGLFFVGITTTGVYCRPVCPSRVATPQHRRFFASPASAEHAGFRPCLRCRPELAPGRAQID